VLPLPLGPLAALRFLRPPYALPVLRTNVYDLRILGPDHALLLLVRAALFSVGSLMTARAPVILAVVRGTRRVFRAASIVAVASITANRAVAVEALYIQRVLLCCFLLRLRPSRCLLDRCWSPQSVAFILERATELSSVLRQAAAMLLTALHHFGRLSSALCCGARVMRSCSFRLALPWNEVPLR